MTTIAKLVTEIGGDPTGLAAALKQSTGAINSFVSTTQQNFQRIAKGTDLTKFVDDAIAKLKTSLTGDVGRIRSDLFRKIIDPRTATEAAVEAGVQFNEGIARTIGQLETSGLTGINKLRNQLAKEFLEVGKLAGAGLGKGIEQGAAQSTTPIASRAGRTFAEQFAFRSRERLRTLVPQLAGLFINQAITTGADVSNLVGGLNEVERAAARAVEGLKGISTVLRDVSALGSFLLPPIAGLLVASIGGVASAIISVLANARDRTRKFRQDFKAELEGMVNDLDQLGLQKKLERVILGERAAGISPLVRVGFRGGLDDLLARQRRDLAALKADGLDLQAGASLVGKTLTASQQALVKLITQRQPLIDELTRQADELRDAILNPTEARGGFGGQLPVVKVTAVAPALKAVKDIQAELGKLVALFELQKEAGEDFLPTLNEIHKLYADIVKRQLELGTQNPFSDQAVALTTMRLEIEKIYDVAKKLGALGVQITPARPVVSPFKVPQPRQLPATQLSEIQLKFQIGLSTFQEGIDAIGGVLQDFASSSIWATFQSIAGQLNPFLAVIGAISDAAAPLAPAMKRIAEIVGATLGPVFEAFAPVIEGLIPLFSAVLRILSPILKALAPLFQAFIPLLEALFPVLKLFAIALTFAGQIIATFAGIILKVVAGLANAVGGAIKAIGTVISKIPFLGGVGRGIANAGQAILNFANASNEAGRDMFAASKAFADARNEIAGVTLDNATDGIKALGDAARDTAGVLNAPTGFKVEFARFAAQDARRIPATVSTQGVVTNNVNISGDINIDARSLSRAELFSLVREEAQRQALARFGTTTRAPEALA